MTEKTQKEDAARSGAEPEAASAEEAPEIKACVGATGGGEGAAAPVPKGDGSAIPHFLWRLSILHLSIC